MCASCGCQGEKTTMLDLQSGETVTIPAVHQGHGGSHYSHDHDHEYEHDHDHEHDHGDPHGHAHHHHHHHDHHHGHHEAHQRSAGDHSDPRDADRHEGVEILDVEIRILKKNDELAAKNRAWFAGREILALNLVSSPGAGKTALLERTIRALASTLPLYVIEGDQATANDGERIRRAGAAVVQVNTGTGCHLDAGMVGTALSALKPPPGAVLLIENVGNLVCPALFDLGERAKVVILSVTDGEDKPLKYPHMFKAAEIVILNKIDLLPHLEFSIATAIANVERMNPAAKILQLSAQTGEGMTEWYDWLRSQRVAARQAAFA